MTEFIAPLSGGLLIGLGASLLLVTLGRIAGISGILWAALSGQPGRLWRGLFLLGLVFGVWLYHAVTGSAYPSPIEGPILAVVAGLLVGLGVKWGSGCTSGHGVCGMARGSVRSLVATGIFMATGVLTVAILRQF